MRPIPAAAMNTKLSRIYVLLLKRKYINTWFGQESTTVVPLISQVGLLLSAEAGVLSPMLIAIAIARYGNQCEWGKLINWPMTTTSQLTDMDRGS